MLTPVSQEHQYAVSSMYPCQLSWQRLHPPGSPLRLTQSISSHVSSGLLAGKMFTQRELVGPLWESHQGSKSHYRILEALGQEATATPWPEDKGVLQELDAGGTGQGYAEARGHRNRERQCMPYNFWAPGAEGRAGEAWSTGTGLLSWTPEKHSDWHSQGRACYKKHICQWRISYSS